MSMRNRGIDIPQFNFYYMWLRKPEFISKLLLGYAFALPNLLQIRTKFFQELFILKVRFAHKAKGCL